MESARNRPGIGPELARNRPGIGLIHFSSFQVETSRKSHLPNFQRLRTKLKLELEIFVPKKQILSQNVELIFNFLFKLNVITDFDF
jgi:hypothetical protein